MAEDSAFWDGGVGDATTADVWENPIDSEEWSDFYSKLIAANKAKAFVIPEYRNSLEVTESSTPAMNVRVNSGALFMRGRIYENTASTTVTLSVADGANPRIDRIVAEITFASQTVRIDVVEGVAGAVPALPALTQDATTYQVDLAHVWVAAAVASIQDEEIADRREFAPTFSAQSTLNGTSNCVVNSEFMGTWYFEPTGVEYLVRWETTGTATITFTAKPDQMSRGQSITVTAGAATSGIYQTFSVAPSTTYAIKLLYNVTAGDVGRINVSTNGAGAVTKTRYLRRTGNWLEELIYYTTGTTASIMTLQLLAQNNTDVVQYGQALVMRGYLPGPFRQFHEVIPFHTSSIENGWHNTNKVVNTYTIDLSADYGGSVLAGTHGVLIGLRGTSNPAGCTVAISGCDTTPTYLSAVVNEHIPIATRYSRFNSMVGIDTSRSFYVDVANQTWGAATLYVVGIVT